MPLLHHFTSSSFFLFHDGCESGGVEGGALTRKCLTWEALFQNVRGSEVAPYKTMREPP